MGRRVMETSNKGDMKMPGFNGTGPNGMGPMTGGGFGYCTGNASRPGRGAGAFGGRRGMGRGMGRGYARANVDGYAATGNIEAKLDSILTRLDALEQKENK